MAKTNYETVKEWRKKNPEKWAEQSKRYAAKYPEKIAATHKRYRDRNIEKVRERDAESHRKQRKQNPEKQKIRMDRFRAKKEAEREKIAGRPRPSVCDICHGDYHLLGIVFDHCHESGKFRGWICDRCNKVLGMVYDDPKLLKRLAKYLEKHGKADYKAEEVTPIEGFCGT